MQKWRQWQAASESDWATAMAREQAIRALAEDSRLSRSAVDEAAAQLGVSRTSIYRLVRRFRQRPQTSSLLPWKRGREVNTQMLDAAREQLIITCINEFYLTRERPSLAALFREVKRLFSDRGLRAPNYRTVRRRVALIDGPLATQKRHGSKAAREKFGPTGGSSLRADLPMDVLQIDHTLVDVIVVDRENRLPIGRPWLTLAIDIASRMVAGFHITLEPPSALSVSLALSHAVLPKAPWLADRELHSLDWPAGGLPRTIHLDNAMEFHSEALMRGCQEYGIQIEHRPPGQPHFGGHIERLIGTMMGAVHLLPGTTFSNVQEKGSYDAEGRAVLTLPELERWLALQIAGVYQLTVHSVLEKTPLEAWREGVSKRKQPIRHPADAEELFLDFLPAVARLIQRDGIHFHRIRYWSSVLSPWAGRRKEPLLVKYDPRNLSRLYLRDPNGRHWAVPYADLGQPPIALWELLETRQRLRQAGFRNESERAVFAHILEQRRIVKQAATSSQQRRRLERNSRSGPETSVPSEPAAQETGELKPYPVEIWEAE